ncbi:MAG: phage portal protein [Thermoguttaceae bacterium]|nr:phage portal protein [Thermoguttaceae bacterium]
MGLMERLFGRRVNEEPARLKQAKTFQMLDGYVPAFHTWNGSIFESDLIRAALDAHGRHAAKLKPEVDGSAKPNLKSRLSIMPNEFQTWPQFLYREAVILYARNTAFIVPTRGEYGEPNGIIGIVPQRWELVEYNGTPYIRFTMKNNKRLAVELWQVGILTRYQYESELFGESNEAMKAVLDLIEMQRQGITEGIKNGASYRFSAQSDNWATDEDLAAEMQRFNQFTFQNKKTAGGLVLFPNTYTNVQQLKQEAYKVDADQQALIKQNVFDYFAVNEDVIQNKTFGDAWLAFYEGAIEWFAIQLSEVLTKMLFSERERQFGNKIWFTSNRLQYMSNADKLNAISTFADRGLMTRNELREIMNLSPLPEEIGNQIPARGEYYDVVAETENGGDTDEQGNEGV